MSWKFKMREEELETKYVLVVQEVEKAISGKMLKYFEIFEAGAINNIHAKLMEADSRFTVAEDWEGLAHALDEYLRSIKLASERVSRGLHNSEKGRIHILKAESGVSEREYRDLLRQIGGVDSSRDMVYWQGMILIRALKRKKERKHGKAV
jgi:hypothetical protein